MKTADEVMVNVIVEGEHYTIADENHDHFCTLVKQENGEFRALCRCGATWTYAAHRDLHWMFSIWVSHLKYANRPKMETL